MQSSSYLETLIIQGIILALAISSLGLTWYSARVGSPILAIIGRWFRWMFISTLVSGTIYLLNLTGYEFGTLLVITILTWYVLETGYNWLAINALSRSDLPLFPKFEENESGEEWPSTPACIRIKDWLRKKGFKRSQALISHLGEMVLMRVSVYENEDLTIRIQVLFLPNPQGGTTAALTCYSATRQGDLIVTDNVFLPFGGFYPENWDVERLPWTRSPEKLLTRHLARIDAKAQDLMPFVLSPLEQINEDQRVVEQLNRDLGFLMPLAEQAEGGRLTSAGKARLWQELWTLAYLGKPLKYN